MPDIPIATGSVVFKGDLSQYERDIQLAEEKLQKLNKGLQDGSLKMAAYAAKGINTEMEKAAKAAKRMMDEVKFGKWGVFQRNLGEMGRRFQERMQQFGKVGVGVGASAIGAASMASPLAGDTLAGSLKLLTVSLGRDFVPLVKDLSYTLQMAAEKWRNMDSAVKDNIVSTVKMVAVAGAASLALVGVMKVLTAIKNHPLLAAAGAGILAGEMINNNIEKNADKQFRALQERNQDLEFARKDARTEMMKQHPKGQWIAEKDMERAWNVFEEKRKEHANYETGTGFMGMWQRGMDWTGGKGRQLREDAANAEAELTKTKLRLDEVIRFKGGQGLARNADMAHAVGGAVGGAGAGAKANMLLGTTGPSSYTSLQEFYRSMNLETTSGSQLEAKIKQEQIEADKQFRDANLKLLGRIADNTGKAA